MSKITVLAEGQITPSDAIVVVLVEPADMPNSIVIHWPIAPTITAPARYNGIASTTMRLLAEASTTLARIRASKRM
jgi:hypothetical protein